MTINNISRNLIWVIILISGFTLGYYFLNSAFSSQQIQVNGIEWHRTGGFAGVDELLTIKSDGSASYFSNLIGGREFSLSEAEWEELVNVVENTNFKKLESSYGPKSDVADFFSYSLEVKTKSQTIRVEWVDDWASEKPLPDELKMIEENHLSIIQGSGQGAVEGIVHDENGNSVSGLLVSIINGSVGFPEIAVITNNRGFYHIGSIPPGIFTLGAHDDLGNVRGLGSIQIQGGKTSFLNITVDIPGEFDNENITNGNEPTDGKNVQVGITVGRKAIDFTITGLHGNNFSLSEHRGEVVVLEFMATWCGFCKLQHIELEKLNADMPNLTIITMEIDVTLKQDQFKEWALEQNYDWFVSHPPEVGWTYRVAKLPTIIVVDKEGIIQYRAQLTEFRILQSLVLQNK
jgi:thiol-disulfide isomerase/thioredoxin